MEYNNLQLQKYNFKWISVTKVKRLCVVPLSFNFLLYLNLRVNSAKVIILIIPMTASSAESVMQSSTKNEDMSI